MWHGGQWVRAPSSRQRSARLRRNARVGVLAGESDQSGDALRRVRLLGISGPGAVVLGANASMSESSPSLLLRLVRLGELLGRIPARPRAHCASLRATAHLEPHSTANQQNEPVGSLMSPSRPFIVATECKHRPHIPCCTAIDGSRAIAAERSGERSVDPGFLEWRQADLHTMGQTAWELHARDLPRDQTGRIDARSIAQMTRVRGSLHGRWAEAPILLIRLEMGETLPDMAS